MGTAVAGVGRALSSVAKARGVTDAVGVAVAVAAGVAVPVVVADGNGDGVAVAGAREGVTDGAAVCVALLSTVPVYAGAAPAMTADGVPGMLL